MLTPLPTIPPVSAEAYALELMKTNNGCKLPCWWGIVPGETMWASTRQFLESFVLKIISWDSDQYTMEYKLPESDAVESMNISVDKGLVQKIYITSGGTVASYQLDQLLSTYGTPSNILVLYSWMGEVGVLQLYLLLYYSEQGILAEYVIDSELVNDLYRSCPKGVGPTLTLWFPTPNVKLTDIYPHVKGFKSLKEATGMNIQSFYELFKNSKNGLCIEAKQP
jgi:hypothetical protein